MAYIDTAKEILKDNIKSAVYIDEKAREFNQGTTAPTGESEEALSMELYTNFREAGVCLEPIRYYNKKEDDPNWMNYCLDSRDLILLDWHLEGKSGQVQSLKILNQVINTPDIHFCVIYTSQENLDSVFKQILTNYSNLSKEQFDEYKEYTESLFEEGFDFSEFHDISLGRNKSESKSKIGSLIKKHKANIDEFKKNTEINDTLCAVYKISSLNLETFYKELKHPLPCPNYINQEKYLIEINNTIIVVFKKKENNPDKLLENFYSHIISGVDSYNQLLAIDFLNRIYKQGIINKSNGINFSKDALFEHRHRLKEEGLDDFFEEFIKELLLEKVSLSLRDSTSKLLSEEIYKELYNPENNPNDEDRQKMNVFYNSFTLNKNGGYINFGDVFKIENEEKYLICLTPLCDCLRPQEKIKRNYFFAEGEHISLKDALDLGDTAFTSFLPNGKVVRWTDVPSKESKYVPIYIKPVQYKVLQGQDSINEDNLIQIFYLNKEGEKKGKWVKYITTIRQNYAQRIANHAFSYPLRVGVDFVKM